MRLSSRTPLLWLAVICDFQGYWPIFFVNDGIGMTRSWATN